MGEPDDEFNPISDREIQKQVDAWGIDALVNPPRVNPFVKFCSDAFMIVFCAFAVMSFLGGIIYGLVLLIQKLLR